MDLKQTHSEYSDKRMSRHNGVSGANFCKYYHRSTETHFKTTDIKNNTKEVNNYSLCHSNENFTEPFQEKSTQTEYRESQAQTDPWDPPFKINKKFKDPDILNLRNFTYGNGLPAGILEVEYISKAKKLKDLNSKSTYDKKDKQFKTKKQVIQNQVKSNWNNRIAALNQQQQEKLTAMQSNTVEDLKRYHMKKEDILKNLWSNKKIELGKTHLQLEQKLQKELHVVERNFPSHLNVHLRKSNSSKAKNHPEVIQGIDYVLKNYYLSNTFGISIVRKWLEDYSGSLICNILPRTSRDNSKGDPLPGIELQKVFEKKTSKHPPVIEDDAYEEENTPKPIPKPEVILEPLIIEKKKVNLVSVLQQALQGLACQKQMLDLIERHQCGLTAILEPLYPGIADS